MNIVHTIHIVMRGDMEVVVARVTVDCKESCLNTLHTLVVLFNCFVLLYVKLLDIRLDSLKYTDLERMIRLHQTKVAST
jgi:hypothetical protein